MHKALSPSLDLSLSLSLFLCMPGQVANHRQHIGIVTQLNITIFQPARCERPRENKRKNKMNERSKVPDAREFERLMKFTRGKNHSIFADMYSRRYIGVR